MGNLSKRVRGFLSRQRTRVLLAMAAAGAASSTASAQFTPDEMEAVVFPITLASVAEAIAAAGALAIIAYLIYWVGFRLVHKLKSRLTRAV